MKLRILLVSLFVDNFLPAELNADTLCSSGSLFGAGSDTTVSALTIVLLAAAAFPKELEIVQAELDRVVGPDRSKSIQQLDKRFNE